MPGFIGLLRPGQHRVQALGCAGCFAQRSDSAASSSMQELGEKLMQHWMEINLVTLQLIETMPQRMCVIKAKGEILECVFIIIVTVEKCKSAEISSN